MFELQSLPWVRPVTAAKRREKSFRFWPENSRRECLAVSMETSVTLQRMLSVLSKF